MDVINELLKLGFIVNFNSGDECGQGFSSWYIYCDVSRPLKKESEHVTRMERYHFRGLEWNKGDAMKKIQDQLKQLLDEVRKCQD